MFSGDRKMNKLIFVALALIPLLLLAPAYVNAQNLCHDMGVCMAGQNASDSSLLPKSLTDSIIKQATNTLNKTVESPTNGTQGFLSVDQLQTEINHLPGNITTEIKTGKIPTNATFLVIYANSRVGPVVWRGSINSGGNSATQDGSGHAVIPINCGSAMSFQNQGESGYLSLNVVDHGKIVNSGLSTVSYGVVTMIAKCTGVM